MALSNSETLVPPIICEPPLADWPAGGVYQLYLRVSVSVRVRVGRLGMTRFPPGRYVYTGRATGQLRARVRRHLTDRKRLHWHIDYLLRRREVCVEGVRLAASDPDAECAVNQAALRGGALFAPGFGASDCRKGCRSHLRYLGST